MNFSISDIANNIVAAAVVSLMTSALSMLIRSIRNGDMKKLKGSAKAVAFKILVLVLHAIPYTFLYWFFFWALRPLVSQDGPPSRDDVFMIAFWTFWLCMVFLRMLAGRPLFAEDSPGR